jgi:single-stranded DNA-binding protein
MTIEAAFLGTLGRDGEVKSSARGKSYLKLNVRVGEGDGATWVSVVAFDETSLLIADRFTKGTRVYVEGKILLNEWTGQAGAKRRGVALMASHCRLAQIGRKKVRDTDNGYRQVVCHRRDDAKRSGPVDDRPFFDDNIGV